MRNSTIFRIGYAVGIYLSLTGVVSALANSGVMHIEFSYWLLFGMIFASAIKYQSVDMFVTEKLLSRLDAMPRLHHWWMWGGAVGIVDGLLTALLTTLTPDTKLGDQRTWLWMAVVLMGPSLVCNLALRKWLRRQEYSRP